MGGGGQAGTRRGGAACHGLDRRHREQVQGLPPHPGALRTAKAAPMVVERPAKVDSASAHRSSGVNHMAEEGGCKPAMRAANSTGGNTRHG